MSETILEVKNLIVNFKTKKGIKKAVDDVSFSINRGEIFGIVGESGCGKSVTSMSILQLINAPGKIEGGEILLDGKNLLELSDDEMQENVRGSRIAMIFQDPMTSLNPLLTVGEQIAETIQTHKMISKEKAKEKAIELLNNVGIPAAELHYDSFPHSLSGGMKQRVMIAIAMSCEPDVLIADEPTTALDVTIQVQILDLMKKMRDEHGTAIILITHDLGVVSYMCDYVAVMYCGKIVEKATKKELINNPLHPYTKGLMAAIPKIDNTISKLYNIPGTVPQIYEDEQGCYFNNRCEFCVYKCKKEVPKEVCTENHAVACHLYKG